MMSVSRQAFADKTARKQRGRSFKLGQSGNPAGRPRGARNKTTPAIEALLDGEAETITRKAIELAKAGDISALRLCLDRIAPPRKDRPVSFDLPSIESAADAAQASAALVAAVASGELTPSEAAELGKLIESYIRALTASDFEARLNQLESGR
jgi:hypothetical protein